MKKIIIGLMVFGSFHILAKDCTMILFKNGVPSGPIAGRATLKKCLKEAAVLLELNQDTKNPTVVVHHTDLENELYIRLRDGLVREH
jgi:hypothetical protein